MCPSTALVYNTAIYIKSGKQRKVVNIFFNMLNCRLEGEGVAQSLRFVDLAKMLKIGDGP